MFKFFVNCSLIQDFNKDQRMFLKILEEEEACWLKTPCKDTQTIYEKMHVKSF